MAAALNVTTAAPAQTVHALLHQCEVETIQKIKLVTETLVEREQVPPNDIEGRYKICSAQIRSESKLVTLFLQSMGLLLLRPPT